MRARQGNVIGRWICLFLLQRRHPSGVDLSGALFVRWSVRLAAVLLSRKLPDRWQVNPLIRGLAARYIRDLPRSPAECERTPCSRASPLRFSASARRRFRMCSTRRWLSRPHDFQQGLWKGRKVPERKLGGDKIQMPKLILSFHIKGRLICWSGRFLAFWHHQHWPCSWDRLKKYAKSLKKRLTAAELNVYWSSAILPLMCYYY